MNSLYHKILSKLFVIKTVITERMSPSGTYVSAATMDRKTVVSMLVTRLTVVIMDTLIHLESADT